MKNIFTILKQFRQHWWWTLPAILIAIVCKDVALNIYNYATGTVAKKITDNYGETFSKSIAEGTTTTTKWLAKSYNFSGIELAGYISVALLAIAIGAVLHRKIKQSRTSPTERYTADIMCNVRFKWDWYWGDIFGLKAYCPEKKCLEEIQLSVDTTTFPQKMYLYCPKCQRKYYEEELPRDAVTNPELLWNALNKWAKKEIGRRIRTGEYKNSR
ncbi:hypothetical protein [Halodesulfovibrio sp.]|uniref:hypothetical protein n=1 Tax=Halodesulfovibrio sp. TaxID=1912772 RepID=UPI0025BB1ED2|nr:hypothetical protein [Halodesulfovibrio sp.]